MLYFALFMLTYLHQGLVGLTNGILRDKRVFHIDDQQWISMYNDQGLESACRHLFALYLYYVSLVVFEAQKFKAWTEGGPDLVIEETQKRLREQGWNAVRPALSTTIRLMFSQIYQCLLTILSC